LQRKSFRITDIITSQKQPHLLAEISNGVLVTLVHTEGSCYQKAGAQLFLSSRDEVYGLISGGCLEHDIVEKAREVREIKQARLVYFDTGDPFDIEFGFGLGCGGKLWVFIEWISDGNELNRKIIGLSTQVYAEAIVIEADSPYLCGQRLFLSPNDEPSPQIIANVDLFHDLSKVVDSKKSQIRQIKPHESNNLGSLKVAFLYRSAQPVITIFGCGLGAWPLAMMAKTLGWELKAYDHRTAYLDDLPEQMAPAHLLDWGEISPFQSDFRQPSAAVVMTHNFHADRRILRRLLANQWKYIGLLGSHARSEQLLQDIFQEHPELKNSPTLSYLHAPIGLDLGGSTPEAIALAIISEIQARWHRRQQISYRSQISSHGEGNIYAASY